MVKTTVNRVDKATLSKAATVANKVVTVANKVATVVNKVATVVNEAASTVATANLDNMHLRPTMDSNNTGTISDLLGKSMGHLSRSFTISLTEQAFGESNGLYSNSYGAPGEGQDGERGIGGAIAGGLAGGFGGHKLGHGVLGTIGGAILGSLAEDGVKKYSQGHGHGSQGGGYSDSNSPYGKQ